VAIPWPIIPMPTMPIIFIVQVSVKMGESVAGRVTMTATMVDIVPTGRPTSTNRLRATTQALAPIPQRNT